MNSKTCLKGNRILEVEGKGSSTYFVSIFSVHVPLPSLPASLEHPAPGADSQCVFTEPQGGVKGVRASGLFLTLLPPPPHTPSPAQPVDPVPSSSPSVPSSQLCREDFPKCSTSIPTLKAMSLCSNRSSLCLFLCRGLARCANSPHPQPRFKSCLFHKAPHVPQHSRALHADL